MDTYMYPKNHDWCLTCSYFLSFQYLCELTLQDSDPYLKYLPSTIAASSVVLALHTFGLPAWVRPCDIAFPYFMNSYVTA